LEHDAKSVVVKFHLALLEDAVQPQIGSGNSSFGVGHRERNFNAIVGVILPYPSGSIVDLAPKTLDRR